MRARFFCEKRENASCFISNLSRNTMCRNWRTIFENIFHQPFAYKITLIEVSSLIYCLVFMVIIFSEIDALEMFKFIYLNDNCGNVLRLMFCFICIINLFYMAFMTIVLITINGRTRKRKYTIDCLTSRDFLNR